MAFEQEDAEFFFQKPDLAAQRRLRDVQAIRSLAQASEFGNMDQGLQLNNIHRRILQQQSPKTIAGFEGFIARYNILPAKCDQAGNSSRSDSFSTLWFFMR